METTHPSHAVSRGKLFLQSLFCPSAPGGKGCPAIQTLKIRGFLPFTARAGRWGGTRAPCLLSSCGLYSNPGILNTPNLVLV